MPPFESGVSIEGASGASHNRRRKRPPWLLCSESKVLCAFGTASSLVVTLVHASIEVRLVAERPSPAKVPQLARGYPLIKLIPPIEMHPWDRATPLAKAFWLVGVCPLTIACLPIEMHSSSQAALPAEMPLPAEMLLSIKAGLTAEAALSIEMTLSVVVRLPTDARAPHWAHLPIVARVLHWVYLLPAVAFLLQAATFLLPARA